MRYTLHDYQEDAVRNVLRNLEMARAGYHQFKSPAQFSLTATTGAGKTVMAAAVIEALFFGSDEYNFSADLGAVVLWFSDDPSLNEQSRIRLQAAASELDSRLKVIETDFGEAKFRPGHVYFLNTQKLSKTSRLVRGEVNQEEGRLLPRPDTLQSSIYDTIRNTIEDQNLTLYLVLDEAHRGMGKDRNEGERSTIVQRLINGKNGVPPLPIVWGISATVDRFEKAMKSAEKRAALPSVLVDSTLVQKSGLLKDDIVLGIPDQGGTGTYDLTLLRRAVDKIKASTAAWAQYGGEQQMSEPVVPLLVVQVADKATPEELHSIVQTIYDRWPELPNGAIANVFGEHRDLMVGREEILYIAPERVQDATRVRVLLAKSAISTGWDCPRAEVLVSFRAAQDQTHITQLLGRMMRTPLARRIPGNELLNSVDCLLPFFDRQTAKQVAVMLTKGATNKDDEAGANEERRVLFNPVSLKQNPAIEPQVWLFFESLPTLTLPRKDVKPIQRLTALATALSRDGLVPGAVEQAFSHLNTFLDRKSIELYSEQLAKARKEVETMRGEEIVARLGGKFAPIKSFSESADPRAIEASFQAAGRLLSIALSKSYADHLAGEDAEEDELLDAHIQVAAIALVPELIRDVELAADALAREWLTVTREQRQKLNDVRKAEYARLEGQSTQPERTNLVVPISAQADTSVRHPNGAEEELESYLLHLMCSEEGSFPADLNSWEQKVLKREMERQDFVGWYRNPSRGLPEALTIPYKESASGDWKALRPDFIFFGKSPEGALVADVVDPHGYHLADALPKLRGLADFAEGYGQEFRRIESVAEVNGQLRVLDLTQESVRAAVRGATDAKALYVLDVAASY